MILTLNRYEYDVDKRVVQLNVFDLDTDEPMGVLNLFAVHPTSMSSITKIISGDNKVQTEENCSTV